MKPSSIYLPLIACATLTYSAVSLSQAVAEPNPELGAHGSASDAHCAAVFGTIETDSLPPGTPCDSPVGTCTAGRISGSLKGDFGFRLDEVFDSSVAGIFHFNATPQIQLDIGGELIANTTGTIDFDASRDGNYTSLITIADGTGNVSGAHGQLVVRGRLKENNSGSEAVYSGEVCLP